MRDDFHLMYDSSEPIPDWAEKLAGYLIDSWQSPGGFSLMVKESKNNKYMKVFVCPSIREIFGGGHDGEKYFPRYMLDLNHVAKAFDKRPKVIFDSGCNGRNAFIIILGRIDSQKIQLAIASTPPQGAKPTEVSYETGPKSGTVEPKLPEKDE